MKCSVFAALFSVAFPWLISQTASSAVLNVDFGKGPIYSGTRDAPDSGTVWNGVNDNAAGGVFGSFVDSNGNAVSFAGVSITTTASAGLDYNVNFADQLLNDNNYTDTNGVASSSLTISGLAIGGLYDLYLYGEDAFLPGAVLGSLFTVTDANGAHQATTTGITNPGIAFPEMVANATGDLSIAYTTNGNSRYGYLCGLQLTPSPSPAIPGDFDADGDVDGADFVAWQTHFPTATSATLADGDADGDGDVDGADFVVWQTHFPFTPGPGASPIPEPCASFLVVMGVTTIVLGRRARSKTFFRARLRSAF